MSDALTGRFINASYKDLLQIYNGNQGIDAVLRVLSDGEGTDSPFYISTTQVRIKPSADNNVFDVLDSAGNTMFSINTSTKEIIAGTGVSFVGDGSQLSGITGATGGISNADSTNIVADSDVDGSGDITLSIGSTELLRLKNNASGDGGSWVIKELDSSKLAALTGTDIALVNQNGKANIQDADGNHSIVLSDKFASPATGYIMDGVDDYVLIPDDVNLNFGVGDFTIAWYGKLNSYIDNGSVYNCIIAKGNGFSTNGMGLYIGGSSDNIRFAVNYQITTAVPYTSNEYYLIIGERTGTTINLYVNNELAQTITHADIGNTADNIYDLAINKDSSGTSRIGQSEPSMILLYNRILSADEKTALWNNGKPLEFVEPYKYQDASNDELVVNGDMELDANWQSLNSPTINEQSTAQVHSGTYSRHIVASSGAQGIRNDFINYDVEKWYKATAYIYVVSGVVRAQLQEAGGNYTPYNNQDISTIGSWQKVEFVAYRENDGTPNTWINFIAYGDAAEFYVDDVSVVKLGNVLNLHGDKMGANGAVGTMGGQPVIANTFGNPIAVNPNKDGKAGVTGAAGTTTDTVLYNSVPRDKTLHKVIVYNNEASARYINIGTSSGATDVVADKAIAASDYTVIPLDEYFSGSDAQTLYISPGATNTDGTSTGVWAGTEDLDIRLYMED